jgi:isopentenyl-diphosphate delta-isomerase
MPQSTSQFEKRKQDHIALALLEANQASENNIFDQVNLVHEALPELNLEDLTLESRRFGVITPKPFLVSSMTAGHRQAELINRHLMEACALSGWAMGVGSQRRELFDDKAAAEWLPLRKNLPQVSLLSNLGIAQIIQLPITRIKKLTDTLHASALIVHCNPLQEMIQPEGTPQFRGCFAALANLVKYLDLPVVVKETGCGFSLKTLKRLEETGVAAVDVAGLGGTHWGRIEGQRAQENPLLAQTAKTFKNWGINTVTAVKLAESIKPHFEIWGSGGVRNGLDAAKLFALGATTAGLAKLLLEAALDSAEAVFQLMTMIEYELKVAMFCTGSRTISDLKGKVCR